MAYGDMCRNKYRDLKNLPSLASVRHWRHFRVIVSLHNSFLFLLSDQAYLSTNQNALNCMIGIGSNLRIVWKWPYAYARILVLLGSDRWRAFFGIQEWGHPRSLGVVPYLVFFLSMCDVWCFLVKCDVCGRHKWPMMRVVSTSHLSHSIAAYYQVVLTFSSYR